MYIHIGNARIVFKRELIGIFHMNLRDNPVNKQFLESANAENFYRNKELERYKISFIVTDSELLLSPIVPTTLARRQKRDR